MTRLPGQSSAGAGIIGRSVRVLQIQRCRCQHNGIHCLYNVCRQHQRKIFIETIKRKRAHVTASYYIKVT